MRPAFSDPVRRGHVRYYKIIFLLGMVLTCPLRTGSGAFAAPEDTEGLSADSLLANKISDQPFSYREEPPGYRDRMPTARETPPGFRTRIPQQLDEPLNAVDKIPGSSELPPNHRENPPNFMEKDSIWNVNNDPSTRISIEEHPGANLSDDLRLTSENVLE